MVAKWPLWRGVSEVSEVSFVFGNGDEVRRRGGRSMRRYSGQVRAPSRSWRYCRYPAAFLPFNCASFDLLRL